MRWRRIKTAPQDGTMIIALCWNDDCHPEYEIRGMKWHEEEDFAGWIEVIEDSEDNLDYVSGDPTHWIPLPKVPAYLGPIHTVPEIIYDSPPQTEEEIRLRLIASQSPDIYYDP